MTGLRVELQLSEPLSTAYRQWMDGSDQDRSGARILKPPAVLSVDNRNRDQPAADVAC